MAYRFLGADPVETQVDTVLTQIAAGQKPRDIERLAVDVKEERGRRGPGGLVLPGATQNEDAADYLAGEMACFANTVGGGAVILGIADDGRQIDTDLDPQWLRHRIYELTERKLTVDIREADLAGTRILVLRAPTALEPIRHHGRTTWRVGDNCVELDAASRAAAHLHRSGFDWSARPSGHRLDEANPVALELARRYLRENTSDAAATELAAAADADLLRRITVFSPGGFVDGVDPNNIITHPSAPRYRGLAQAMASLRLAEREGIGVDRMIRDMLVLGHQRPEIVEIAGPYIKIVLVGGDPNSDWMDFLAELDPEAAGRNLDLLLVLDRLLRSAWIDAKRAAPLLQRSMTEAASTLAHLSDISWSKAPAVIEVAGVPASELAGYRLSDGVRGRLSIRVRPLMAQAGRREVILDWARSRGRVSSTEVKGLTGVSSVYAGTLLKELASEGHLAGSSASKRGRGFFYRPVSQV